MNGHGKTASSSAAGIKHLSIALLIAAVVVVAHFSQPAGASATSFFTAQAKKCMTEKFETLSPATQRLCLAMDTLLELADVMDEKTLEDALRRGMNEEFIANKLMSKGGVIDPSVKRDDKYEHMFMRFGRKRRSATA
jgi:hypothetical protein